MKNFLHSLKLLSLVLALAFVTPISGNAQVKYAITARPVLWGDSLIVGYYYSTPETSILLFYKDVAGNTVNVTGSVIFAARMPKKLFARIEQKPIYHV